MRNAALSTCFVALFLGSSCRAPSPEPDAPISNADVHVAPDSNVTAGISVRGPVSMTFTEGVTVGIPGGVGPQPRPVELWSVFRSAEDVCASVQATLEQPGELLVVLRGSDDQETFLPPGDGTYPIHPGIAGGPALTAQLVLHTDDGDGPPTDVAAASGSVRFEGVSNPTGPRMYIDAVLEDGTTVRGGLDLTWCSVRW